MSKVYAVFELSLGQHDIFISVFRSYEDAIRHIISLTRGDVVVKHRYSASEDEQSVVYQIGLSDFIVKEMKL